MDVTDEVSYHNKNKACHLFAFRCSSMLILYLLTAFVCTQTGLTPLIWACDRGLSDVAQLLINEGVNMDVTDEVSYHNTNKLTHRVTY